MLLSHALPFCSHPWVSDEVEKGFNVLLFITFNKDLAVESATLNCRWQICRGLVGGRFHLADWVCEILEITFHIASHSHYGLRPEDNLYNACKRSKHLTYIIWLSFSTALASRSVLSYPY